MRYVDIDWRTALQQIGRMNLLAISGGRHEVQVRHHEDSVGDALVLKVDRGYSVHVLLAADDTYTVQRVFTRSGKVKVVGEQTGVYADELGEVAYQAHAFRSHDFPRTS